MYRFLTALFIVASLSNVASGQSGNPASEFGMKPYGSFNGGDIDSVNLLNLSLNVHIPLTSVPQRGGKALGFSIYYLSPTLEYKLDGPTCTSDPRTCNTDWSLSPLSSGSGGIIIAPDNFPGAPSVSSD